MTQSTRRLHNSTVVLFAALSLVFTAAPTFAQRASSAGAPHSGGASPSHPSESFATHSSDVHSGSAEHNVSTHSAAAIPSSSAIKPAQPGASGAQSGGFSMPTSASSGASAHAESSARNATSSAPSLSERYPRQITIGFPPAKSGDPMFPSIALLRRGTVVEGQRGEVWAESSQRGAMPQHPSAPVRTAPPIAPVRPVSSPRSTAPSHMPVSGAHITPPLRRMTGTGAAPRPFWFLTRQPASGAPHVFTPRPRRPRFFDGFGFFGGTFGFGFPFVGLGFYPNCNPFWAWPWAYGCASFGYWDGFAYWPGYFSGAVTEYTREEPQETEPTEEPATNTFIPPPPEPSSPDEIQAEKSLVVLYMKNGAVYAVTDYWVADGKLHYLTAYGAENTIDMDDLDLQKTVDVNANRGVSFTLKPAPDQNPPQPPQNPQDQPKDPDPPGPQS